MKKIDVCCSVKIIRVSLINILFFILFIYIMDLLTYAKHVLQENMINTNIYRIPLYAGCVSTSGPNNTLCWTELYALGLSVAQNHI